MRLNLNVGRLKILLIYGSGTLYPRPRNSIKILLHFIVALVACHVQSHSERGERIESKEIQGEDVQRRHEAPTEASITNTAFYAKSQSANFVSSAPHVSIDSYRTVHVL